MFRLLIYILICVPLNFLSALSIPREVRKEYATKFQEAFVLQSTGATRRAFYCFKQAYQLAQKAGESTQKLQLMNELFVWYRRYGYFLGVTSNPSGCVDEYQSECQSRHFSALSFPSLIIPLARIPDYYSEYGNTPEQAAKIREFIFGVGETISGIFCITLSGGLATAVGGTALVGDGVRRMFFSLNDVWAQHERSLIELKKMGKEGSSRSKVEIGAKSKDAEAWFLDSFLGAERQEPFEVLSQLYK